MKFFTYARKVRMALDYKGVSDEPLERCYSIDRTVKRKSDTSINQIRGEVYGKTNAISR
jgi:hypothetical protein